MSADISSLRRRVDRWELNSDKARISVPLGELRRLLGHIAELEAASRQASIDADIIRRALRDQRDVAERSLAEARRLLKTARDRIDRYADTADEHCLVADIDALLSAARPTGGTDHG